MSDLVHRFHFRTAPVRGQWIRLETAWAEACATQDYEPAVRVALGEMLAVVAMIAHTIDFSGAVALQSSGNGPIGLALAECTHRRQLRGIARRNEAFPAAVSDTASLRDLIGEGRLALTLLPDQGETYQGLIQLTEPDLARNIEGYFRVSEQIPTRLRIGVAGNAVVGCLLQRLPDPDLASDVEIDENDEHWRRVSALFDTLRAEELAATPVDRMLRTVFNRDLIQLDDGQALEFYCPCSAERTAHALRTMSEAELEEILAEQGAIKVTCEFCGKIYLYGARELHKIMRGEDAPLH